MDILLVDDEEDILRSIGRFLEDFGHQVLCANDGLEALERLAESGTVELIVSDIRMPRVDGIEFLRTVRTRFPGITVLLMTGYGDEDIAIEAFHGGAYDYLKKPVKLRDLLGCIDRLQDRKRLEQQLLESSQHLFQ